MASDQERAQLYASLRAAFLSRHFAVGRYFRANLFSDGCRLGIDQPADQVLAKDPTDQEPIRWDRTRDTDNPLLWGGQLLTCLAVENFLGQPHAERILRTALLTLKSLYKFAGNHFDGYINRWDPTTSDKWQVANGQPQISDEFLVDQTGNYLSNNPATDPRHVPLRSRDALVRFMGEQEADRFLQADGNMGDWRWDYFDRYRRWELSMDELVGLVMGYFMINKLTSSAGIRMEVQREVNNLGDYLAENAYLLVRPAGGLNARGATGILPALEFPLVRAMLSITGNTYDARTNFQGAMEKAGYWNYLSGPLVEWTVIGVVGLPVVAPLLTGVIAALGVAPFVPEAFGLAGIALPAAGIPAAIAGAAIAVASVPIARTYAIYAHRDCFDVANEAAAQEVAVAFLLMENLPPPLRFQGWMFGSGFTGGKDGSYASGFPPFLGLTALDDPDPTVRDAYLGWLAERHKHPGLEPEGNTRAEGCFASAIAVLLGAGPAEEARLAGLLDARYADFMDDRTSPRNFGANLPVIDVLDGQPRVWNYTKEAMQPAMDYMCGLALAWLHAKRRMDAGNLVTTAGFPGLPSNTLFWPRPTVPANVVQAAQAGTIALPVSAIQGTASPRIDSDGAALFDTSDPPHKSPIPAPVLPPSATALVFDRTITVSEADREVYAGIVLQNGDEYEFEATGSIWAGVVFSSNNGPNGWEDRIAWDAHFPLHGALDPVNAHPFCLLGRLGGYFFIGENRARERFLYHRECPLWLRINDDVPGNGSGSLQVRVRVWGQPRQHPDLPISCVVKHRGTISHVGGVHPGGWHWKLRVADAVAEIEAGGSFYVERPGVPRVNVIIARSPKGRKYLRTVEGGGPANNLGSLPRCDGD